MNAAGAILQKSAINRIVSRAQKGSFTASFVRDPIWISGLVVSIGVGTIFNFAAQNRIGPALVPALTASGMVILALGSARILNEKLKSSEWLGIFSLVIGIAFLAFSRLQIPKSEVDLLDVKTQIRIAVFSFVLVLCWGLSWLAAQRIRRGSKGLLLAISAGFPFCLSNLWILPLLMTIGLVFSGAGGSVEVIFFILSCIILVVTNMLGIRQTQESYRYAPANKAQPLQQVPTQISPILIYLTVFQRSIVDLALFLVPLGVALILAGGFLLGKRRLDIKSSESTEENKGPA
jgi:drug/metabolite transporter (DMT)-like permease